MKKNSPVEVDRITFAKALIELKNPFHIILSIKNFKTKHQKHSGCHDNRELLGKTDDEYKGNIYEENMRVKPAWFICISYLCVEHLKCFAEI